MNEGIVESHNTVLRLAPGGGTTMTAVMVIGSRMTVAHVGDSRAYAVYMDGRMQVLTRDHSLVRRLEELGQITPEEASNHPQRHVLYRALGLGVHARGRVVHDQGIFSSVPMDCGVWYRKRISSGSSLPPQTFTKRAWA